MQPTPFQNFEELSKKLSRLNDNLMKDLVSTNFAGNKPCRKREMQGLWHFVATWESPDAGGSPGVCALLWLLNSRRVYPCIAGTQRPQPWTWESVVSKCLVTLLARVNFIEIFLSSPLLFSSNWCFIKKYFFFLLDTLIQKCFSGGVETFVILGQSMVWPTDGGGFALKGKMTDCPCTLSRKREFETSSSLQGSTSDTHPTLPQQWICRRPHLSHSSAAEMHLPSVYLPAQLLKLRWTRQELCPLIRCITWANPAPNLILHQVNQVQKSRANWPCSPSSPASPLECKSRGLQSFHLVICSH